MPLQYARRLTGSDRTAQGNLHLGLALAFIAGAANAGSFLAVHQYTSHMTGIVSEMADNLALGSYELVLGGASGLLSFLAGSIVSCLMVNHARRRRLRSEYALPLLLEAALLLGFGVVGAKLAEIRGLFVPATVMLLCFIMGLQNAVISKITHSEIRTTHITGIVTDIGIELGRLLYRNPPDAPADAKVFANRQRLRMLTSLAVSFFVGGVAGALGFKHVGYIATVPLALGLVLLTIVPAADDALVALRRKTGR